MSESELYAIFAKGGIGAVVIALFLRWVAIKGEQVATWLTTQFEAFHAKATEAARVAQIRCEAENAKLADRVTLLEDTRHTEAQAREQALHELVALTNKVISKQADNETDRHKAIKDAHP